MKKTPEQEYTAEFKALAVKRVKGGLTVGAAARELGLIDQTLRNWVKAADAGKLNGAGVKPVTAEQMELSRIRAENIRLMRENGIRARHKRKFKVPTDSKHKLPIAPNLLDRNFAPAASSQVWTSAITYLWTDEGWLYLAIVLDLFNRQVVGWSLKPRMTADIVTDALTMAWFRRKPAPGVMHNEDRGSQYASGDFQDKLAEYGMICSMSRKGNCWDNAPTESWFNSFKNERVHGWRFATREDMTATACEYIEGFYNRKRLHSTLGYKAACAVLTGLAGCSADGKTGSMNATRWKPKNRGKLRHWELRASANFSSRWNTSCGGQRWSS